MNYPDQFGPRRLSELFCRFFAGFSCVRRRLLIGSLARGDWDRWSDVDLLLVVDTIPGDCYGLFAGFLREFPLVHHGFLASDPSGKTACVLGNAFQDESPFHVLDLNFVSAQEFDPATVRERFGAMKEAPAATVRGAKEARCRGNPTAPWTEDEQRVWSAMHWVHKNVKKRHRGQASLEAVAKATGDLRTTLAAYPGGVRTPNGSITSVAAAFLPYADDLLSRDAEA